MKEFFWRLIAKIVSKPAVANWLISYSKRRPFHHLPSNDKPTYMERYWTIGKPESHPKRLGLDWLIPVSIRVHHIKREDGERHLHDHPWDARTIILKGWYLEKRLVEPGDDEYETMKKERYPELSGYAGEGCYPEINKFSFRYAGDTATLGYGEFHKIVQISDEPVYTLFFAWKWQGVWGFLVNSKKIPWREYLGVPHGD